MLHKLSLIELLRPISDVIVRVVLSLYNTHFQEEIIKFRTFDGTICVQDVPFLISRAENY